MTIIQLNGELKATKPLVFESCAQDPRFEMGVRHYAGRTDARIVQIGVSGAGEDAVRAFTIDELEMLHDWLGKVLESNQRSPNRVIELGNVRPEIGASA
ncbi:MAG TPA: hypothetical protein VNZ94_00330 [Xanthobacteraceae bacterium]|nr:hypothetical protein [Xanthobacteraceae bacterium]